MSKNILMVLTSNDDLGGVRKTGYYVPEAAHPYEVFTSQGYTVDFVSPKGGEAPKDGYNAADVSQTRFLEENKDKLATTLTPEQVNPQNYHAIFFAGGHGTIWDFPNNTRLAEIASSIYESGGVVSAVCHGPAALVNLRLSNGDFLVKGKTVAAFTNAEEEAVKLTNVVPFLLESKLIERGAIHVTAPNFQANVQTSARLVTGQNPASARGVAEAVVKVLEQQTVHA
jgi:putative intracellular protease/amidase